MAVNLNDYDIVNLTTTTYKDPVTGDSFKLLNLSLKIESGNVLEIGLDLETLSNWIKKIEFPEANWTDSEINNSGYMSALDKKFINTLLRVYNFLVIDPTLETNNNYIDNFIDPSNDGGLLQILKNIYTKLNKHLVDLSDGNTQIIGGKFHEIDEDALLILGNGESKEKPSNLFVVKKNGEAFLGNESEKGLGDNKVATLADLPKWEIFP